jgi:hypothetical protein
MWDDTFYTEMANFYAKRHQGHLTDTALFNKLKSDTRKYFKKLNQFKYRNILCPFLESDYGLLISYVFFDYTEDNK